MDGILLFLVFAVLGGEVCLTTAEIGRERVLSNDAHSRISGGNKVEARDYPWMAHISLPSDKSCGGVLISCNHILTAAHCIVPFDKTKLIKDGEVSLGDVTPGEGVTFGIRDTIVHPDFNPDGFDGKSQETIHNDLAIVVLDGATEIRPVSIGKKPPRPGAKGIILGWGETESYSSSSRLQETTVSILGNKECEGTVPKKYFDSDSSICTGPDLDRPGTGSTYTAACSGDSGGPMVDPRSRRLLGIISYSFGSASSSDCGENRKTVLASVKAGKDMIIDTIKDSLDESCRPPFKPNDKNPNGKKPTKFKGKKRHA
jgi:trypsin